MTCSLGSEFVEPDARIKGFGNRFALARFVRGHRRVSLLGSVETESAICSEPTT
jgi:hypothetical protein